MADYTEEQLSAYEDIAEAGGVITFSVAATSDPADPSLPWEGNDLPPTDFAHVAALFPIEASNKQNADSNHRILIPAANLPFEITMNMEFRDSEGRKYAITAISLLAPDPAQLILYDCECALWPTQAA